MIIINCSREKAEVRKVENRNNPRGAIFEKDFNEFKIRNAGLEIAECGWEGSHSSENIINTIIDIREFIPKESRPGMNV